MASFILQKWIESGLSFDVIASNNDEMVLF